MKVRQDLVRIHAKPELGRRLIAGEARLEADGEERHRVVGLEAADQAGRLRGDELRRAVAEVRDGRALAPASLG